MDLNGLISVTCFIVLILEVIAGIFGNIFIISVIFFKNSKGLDKNVCNKIIVALAISSVCHAGGLTFNMLLNYLWPGIYASLYIAYTIFLLILYSANSCVWLIAILSFFYFIKITTFSSQIFTWTKMKIRKIINWMIFMSQMVSVLSTSLNLINLLKPKESTSSNSTVFSNMTAEVDMQLNIAFFSNCVPMFIMMVTTVSTVVFLILHRRRLKKNMGTFVSENTSAYDGVVRTMISFLVFYAIYYVALFMYSFTYSLNSNGSTNPGYWIMSIMMYSFTPVQSIFLISGIPNLKHSWEHMISFIKDKLSLSTGD